VIGTLAVVLVLAHLAQGQGPQAEAKLSESLGHRPLAFGQQEVISEVRVHGNHVVTDDEVLKISGITIGAPFTSTTIAEVKKRLGDSKKFDTIDVLKRFASIEDPTRIVVVMIVNEGGVRIQLPAVPGTEPKVVKRAWYRSLMYMPILDAEDGYGFTYGVRVAYPGVIGDRSRLSFPLTWGGFKRAGVEVDRTFTRGPFSRVEVGSAIQRRTNPGFEIEDSRRRVWARAERAIGPVRAGVTGGWQDVTFDTIEDEYPSIGADIAFDTRLDPILPRNAVYVSASIERLFFESRPETNRIRVDARGFLGLIGQSVAVLRVVREDANEPLPPYLQSLLGGWSSLRGFRAGAFVGDTMVNGSLEIRFPISSPLSFGKLGLSAFVDTGTTYAKGQRFKDQPLYTGVGGSVWIAVTALRLGLSVAHGQGSGTRVNFGGGLTF
jgi:outer membrane protein assembly factor BamA